MPIKKKINPIEMDKSKSALYLAVFNGTNVNVTGLASAASSCAKMKSFI